MKYIDLKNKHSKNFNAFKYIFFAFSDDQFNEGMKKLNLNAETDLNKIVPLKNGGYVLKEHLAEFKKMFLDADNELETFLKDDKNLKDALIYELANHEYCYTYDYSDALDALGLSIDDINPIILQEAIQEVLKNSEY